MKKMIYGFYFALILGIALLPAQGRSADNPLPAKQWDAPVMPGGTLVKTSATAVFIEYNLPYEKVLAWYKEALKNNKDPHFNVDWTKYRDWNDQMYIEDQGGAKWHSIGISKGGGEKTTVKIVRDNMTWVFSTLLIRFAGVFIVLCFLWILLNISGSAMKRFFSNEKAMAHGN